MPTHALPAPCSQAAKKLLLPDAKAWNFAFEKQGVEMTVGEAGQSHTQTLQVQGLYLPATGYKMPVDIAAHWLMPAPFGRDSKNDPIGSSDTPAFQPKASEMRLSATDGYKPRARGLNRDAGSMIFDSKMIE